jgi:cell division protein FtsB
MNPTLISGFEDIIAHINQQEQRVMALEEENKKLKADLEFSEDKVRDLTHEVNDRVVIEDIAELFGSDEGDYFDWESEILGMVSENKKLKKKFEVMNSVQEAFRKQIRTEMGILFNSDDKKPEKRIIELEKEVQRLIATIQTLELEHEQDAKDWREEAKHHKEKKDFYEKLLRDGPVSIERIRWIKKENNKLREENEKLGEKNNKLREENWILRSMKS